VLGHKDRRDDVRVGPEEVSPRPRSVGRGGGDAVRPCEVCGGSVGGARSAPRRPAGGQGGAGREAHSLKRILSTSLSQFSMPVGRACTSGGCTRVAGTGSAAGTHRRPVALRASGEEGAGAAQGPGRGPRHCVSAQDVHFCAGRGFTLPKSLMARSSCSAGPASRARLEHGRWEGGHGVRSLGQGRSARQQRRTLR
jgi:hypothetical protein